MKVAKKILPLLVSSLLIFSINFSTWSGLPGGSTTPYERTVDVIPPTVDEELAEDIDSGSKMLSDKVLWIITVPKPDDYGTSLSYILALVQVSINWALWLLSFVALIYMLYCGFLVFSSGSEDKNAQKGKKWIKTAVIALAWIGLSRLIISAMIWLITNVAWSN